MGSRRISMYNGEDLKKYIKGLKGYPHKSPSQWLLALADLENTYDYLMLPHSTGRGLQRQTENRVLWHEVENKGRWLEYGEIQTPLVEGNGGSVNICFFILNKQEIRIVHGYVIDPSDAADSKKMELLCDLELDKAEAIIMKFARRLK